MSSILTDSPIAGTGIYSKRDPISVRYGIGIAEHDTEGRVITAEYENFYLVTACEYRCDTSID